MSPSSVREPAVPEGEFDASVASALQTFRRGVVLLLEVVPPWPLQVRWLEQQVKQVAPSGVVHWAGEALLAVVIGELGPAEAWVLQERLKDRAGTHHVGLFVGCATWPMQGSSPMDLVAAAAASLLDEHNRYHELMGDEVAFEIDGVSVSLGVAGELLTG